MRLALLATVGLALGCSSKVPSQPDATATVSKPATPKPLPKARKKRKKIKLPDPMQPPPRPEGEPGSLEDFQSLDAYKLRVGKVFVDRLTRRVEIPAQVNMTEGILEYYAVSSNGKLHESVLELFAEPSHIHLALVLIGLDPTVYDRSDPMKPPVVTKPGGELHMFVRFQDPKQGKEVEQAAELWLYNRARKGAPEPARWVFQGSAFWNNRYSADSDRSVTALIPDESAVVGTRIAAGNPYQGGELGYEVFTKVIPPKGTKVTYILEAVGPKPPAPTEAREKQAPPK